MQDPDTGKTWLDRLRSVMTPDNCRSLASDRGAYQTETTIFRVPRYMNNHPYPEAFKPQLCRLGLFQHDPSEKAMDSFPEKIKLKFAAVLASNLQPTGEGFDGWTRFVRSISEDDNDPERDVWCRRKYGNSELLLDKADIPHRLALDALFVLVVLCNVTLMPKSTFSMTSPLRQWFKHVDWERDLMGQLGYFFRDLVLLENQIPMDVLFEVNLALHRVYDEIHAYEAHTKLLKFAMKQAVVGCFPFLCGRERLLLYFKSFHHEKDIFCKKHILDCVYWVICGYDAVGNDKYQRVRVWPSLLVGCLPKHYRTIIRGRASRRYRFSPVDEIYRVLPASKLAEAGIVVQATAMTLSDIRFEMHEGIWRRPTLYLPKVKVTSNTVAMFRNLGLYEQLCYPDRYDVRSYLQLMDQLVDTKEDVELLSKRGLFVNLLCNDEKAADMWNHMCDGLCDPVHSGDWQYMVGAMAEHYSKIVNSRWYEFRRNYLDSSRPWVIGGSFLFLLVTLCTVASTLIDIIQLP